MAANWPKTCVSRHFFPTTFFHSNFFKATTIFHLFFFSFLCILVFTLVDSNKDGAMLINNNAYGTIEYIQVIHAQRCMRACVMGLFVFFFFLVAM